MGTGGIALTESLFTIWEVVETNDLVPRAGFEPATNPLGRECSVH